MVEYFHFRTKSRGDRYFKVDWENGIVIQVVMNRGEKKAAIHCIGVYFITMVSFRSGYYWMLKSKNPKLLYTTANQYKQAFQKILNLLNREQWT